MRKIQLLKMVLFSSGLNKNSNAGNLGDEEESFFLLNLRFYIDNFIIVF